MHTITDLGIQLARPDVELAPSRETMTGLRKLLAITSLVVTFFVVAFGASFVVMKLALSDPDDGRIYKPTHVLHG
jgi:hypothetical protein